jgi:hypothetical protein
MVRSMLFLLSVPLLLAFLVPAPARSQEIDCTVQVNYEALPSSNKELMVNFASDLRDYLNNYRWGQDNLDEKVKCAFNIYVQSVVGEDRYSAQIFVGSQRKIYGTGNSSAVLRLFDDSWEFTYVKNRSLNHTSYSFNDLTSLLDFYVYLILGYDYDTYELMSGGKFLQKAADVSALGENSGTKGWSPSTTNYSRGQLISEILSPIFEPLRKASFTYHFAGLDSLGSAPDKAYRNMLQALRAIAEIRKRSDPRNLVLKTFFDTKYQEIAATFLAYPDPNVYNELNEVDPAHVKTYAEFKAKRMAGQ